jgi:hypothetical protein
MDSQCFQLVRRDAVLPLRSTNGRPDSRVHLTDAKQLAGWVLRNITFSQLAHQVLTF